METPTPNTPTLDDNLLFMQYSNKTSWHRTMKFRSFLPTLVKQFLCFIKGIGKTIDVTIEMEPTKLMQQRCRKTQSTHLTAPTIKKKKCFCVKQSY